MFMAASTSVTTWVIVNVLDLVKTGGLQGTQGYVGNVGLARELCGIPTAVRKILQKLFQKTLIWDMLDQQL